MLAFSVSNFTLFLQPQKNVNKIQERMTAEIEFKVGGGSVWCVWLMMKLTSIHHFSVCEDIAACIIHKLVKKTALSKHSDHLEG